jgi:hypothetical protein
MEDDTEVNPWYVFANLKARLMDEKEWVTWINYVNDFLKYKPSYNAKEV